MKTGAVTVLVGLGITATVAALYLWPSTAGDDCPPLTMTAEQIEADDTLTHERSFAVQEAASARSQCLLESFERYGMTKMPEPLGAALRVVAMPFVSDDLRRLLELQSEVWAAQEAMDRRIDVWMGLAPQANEQE
jgi:hypothetical protein